MKTTLLFGEGRTPTLSAAREAFTQHLRLLGRSEATIKAHANAVNQFAKVWGERDLREVSQADLEAYAKGLRERVGRETTYLYLSGLRLLFRYLAESHVLLVDPTVAIPMPRMSDRMTGPILSREEMKRLIDSVGPSTPIGLRDRAILEFLYSTGLRVTENRRVKVEDLGADAVTVRSGKGAKDRVVPVGVSALQWVRRYLSEVRPAFAIYDPAAPELWLTRWGNAFGEVVFQQHLRALGEAAGIEHLTCHTIRRSMATHLLAAGASPLAVSGILGHSDLKSLSRYVRVAQREVKETHEKTHPRDLS